MRTPEAYQPRACCSTNRVLLHHRLRDGRLHQPNHADADVLLRAWADPTVAALVPTISVNKVPREVHAL